VDKIIWFLVLKAGLLIVEYQSYSLIRKSEIKKIAPRRNFIYRDFFCILEIQNSHE